MISKIGRHHFGLTLAKAVPGAVRTFGAETAVANRRSRRSRRPWLTACLMLLRAVERDASARSAISSSRLVHRPSADIAAKITRITLSRLLKNHSGGRRCGSYPAERYEQ